MLRVRRVRVYVDGGALLLPVDRHVLTEAIHGASATRAPSTIATTAPAFAPIAPVTTAFATFAALAATLGATTNDDP